MAIALLSTLTRENGDQLAVHDWPLLDGQTPRGTVFLVHGLGEHMGRYAQVAARFNSWGFHVRGHDHYGHGLSSGPRGRLPTPHHLLDDLARVMDATPRRGRVILLGHSMGGVVATRFVAEELRAVDALVLSSPGFVPRLNALHKLLLATLPHIVPQLCVDNNLDPAWLARDPQAVQAYQQDPLVHHKISAALGYWIFHEGASCIAAARQWHTPTLLMYAGQDQLVNPEGSAQFQQAAPSGVVTSHCYTEMYHEIFNDPGTHQVFADLRAWLMPG